MKIGEYRYVFLRIRNLKQRNMKNLNVLLTVLFLQLLAYNAYGQQSSCGETMEESLQQTAEILNRPESKELWGISLNAPVIIIDHFNNKMFFTAIENGVMQTVKEEQWDNKVPLANSFFEYDGKKYITIIHATLMNTPCEQRVNLLTHEIFHLHQNSLGIENQLSANYHMDEAEGRALLQIEMGNLQRALDGDAQSLYDALYIRAYRQSLYPNNNEDLYELNEGLAEYTGVKLSTTNMREYVKSRLNYDISKGYANAFGYFTGSAYADILDELYPEWKRDKDLGYGMIYLIKKTSPQHAFVIDDVYLEKLLDKYNYDKILSEEKEELKSFGDIAQFEELLKPGTRKLLITNSKINFTYNPHDRVITIGDAVLLRNMTLTGEWGQINVKKGIVRLNNWSAFYLLPPKRIAENIVEGDDYKIQINQGWKAIEKGGIYTMVKE
ncbi:hypothetical protein ACFO6W_24140 [Dysgonomonas termitidis]|uniref:Peptidase M48 domain-containing protein n=1 Tax=Dysgonomonas termitidis TaxID=1516126 RepID=A0ABV9L4T4_9BACT